MPANGRWDLIRRLKVNAELGVAVSRRTAMPTLYFHRKVLHHLSTICTLYRKVETTLHRE